jgi:hypothetical protein
MYIIMREWSKSPISSRASSALKNTIYDVELMIIFYYIIIIIIIIIIICKSSKRDCRINILYLYNTRVPYDHTRYGNGRDSVGYYYCLVSWKHTSLTLLFVLDFRTSAQDTISGIKRRRVNFNEFKTRYINTKYDV